MEAQMQIRQEAQEKQEVLQDLLRWAPETQKQPGRRHATTVRSAGPAVPGNQEGIAPLRSRRSDLTQNKGTSSFASNTLRESTTVRTQASNGSAAGHTYDKSSSKWDKFDYDSAMAEADDENGSQKQAFSFPKSSKPAHPPSRTPRAPVQTGMEPRQQNLPLSPAEPTDAELWKDRGNKAFSAQNYAQAKQDYTQSIALQPTCLAHANRAMAELKLGEFSAAEADCTKAIALDAAYVKAYLRRASALKQLGKLLEAAEDYEYALRLEPTSKATLADRRACLDQLLMQEGLQSPPLRAAIPVSPSPAQASAAKPPSNATHAAPSTTAQPLSGTPKQGSTPQASSKSPQAKPTHSQQDTCMHSGASAGTHDAPPQQSKASQQRPAFSSMPSAANPAHPPQQSQAPVSAKEPSNVSWQGSRQGQPSSNQVPRSGLHTRSTYGMASHREPSVVIEEVLSDEEDLTSTPSQDPTPSTSSPATSAAAAAPSTSAPATSAASASTERSAIKKPAGTGPAVAPSKTPPLEDSLKGQSSNAADAWQGTSSSSGLSPAADDQAASGTASDKVLHRVSDKASDRASDRASDVAPDSASDIASDRASHRVSGTQALSSAAAAQQASDQQASALPVAGPEDTAQAQQADPDKVQQAGMQDASPDAQRQPISTKASLSQLGNSEAPSQKSMRTSGQAPPSLTGAQADGSAASVAAPQGSGLFKEPHSAPEATASRDQQLQAAALEGTAASSPAAVNAGLSLATPRSGSEFEVSWKRLKGNAAGKEGFLRQLDPLQLPTLFKQSLTAPVLQGIALSALDMMMAQNDHFGIQLLENLKCVPRFDMIVMSLPKRQKAELREHYDAAQNAPVVDSVLAKRLESVRRSYRV